MRFFVCSCLLVVGCSRSHNVPSFEHDSGALDASMIVPGVDAAMDDAASQPDADDAENDTQVDASSDRDASEGGEPKQTLPEQLNRLTWIPLTWAPEYCEAQIATAVDSLDEIPWTVAPGNASACEVWGDGNWPRYRMQVHPGGGFEVRSGSTLIVCDDQGVPKFALRARCRITSANTGSAPCYAISPGQHARIKCGDLLGESPVFESDLGIDSLAASEDLILGRMGYDYAWHTTFIDRTGASAPTLAYSGKQVLAATVHGTTALAISETEWDDADPERRKLVRSIDAGPWQLLHDPGERNVLTFATDGKQVAWIEVDALAGFVAKEGGLLPQEGTLYLAPLPAPGAALMPIHVSDLDVTGLSDELALVNGVIAHQGFSEGVHLYRVSEHAHTRWKVPLPEEYDNVYSSWLGETHVTYELTPPENYWSMLIRCPLATVMGGPPE